MDLDLKWETDDRLVAAFSGEIGWDARDELVPAITEAVDGKIGSDGVPKIIIDLENVDFVNSAGIGALFQLIKDFEPRKGKIVMANLPLAIVQLFNTVGLNRFVPFADSMEEARRKVESDES
jgi:anti-sigma B factor antagonist